MKLLRIADPGAERPYVLLAEDEIIDVSDATADFGPAFFDSDALARLVGIAAAGAPRTRLEPGKRLGAPPARPGKIVCIRLNHTGHADESGQQRPAEPVVFAKAGNTFPGDIINTGTPSWAALGMADPVYLQQGIVVERGIAGLGRQRQTFVAAS